jgi:endonuclease/exonuclease/phosphatase family metal-dependent hydrolase
MAHVNEISLVTLNTWKCDGDYLRRLELMRDGFRELRPDVILLQEVFVQAETQLGTAATLATALDMQLRFEPARYNERQYPGGCGPSWSGMAVLSRLPIRRSERLDLPTHPRDGDRLAQLVVLEWDEALLLLINVHLTYMQEEVELRAAQLANILRHPLLRQQHAGIVMAGDFNEPPEGALFAWLRQQPRWKIVDCFQALHGDAPRHSTISGGTADAAVGPNMDYVLSLQHGAATSLQPVAARYVFDRPEPVSGLYVSDHFGLQVRLRR